MESQTQSLHILFFPFMAPGHMIPMVNMAKIFAKRGVRGTIVTTPANAPFIRPSIDRVSTDHPTIQLALIPFPSASVGLPDGCENLSSLTNEDLQPNFLQGVAMLRQPFEQILEELLPDAIVTDSFFSWTVDATMALGIPRLVFNGTGFFPRCVNDTLNKNKPHENLPAGTESFVLPGLPHRIELLRAQVPDARQFEPIWPEILIKAKDSLMRSFGVVVNSFYELEPEYVDYYRTVTGLRAWHIGPVSLSDEGVADEASIGDSECLDWLDKQRPSSVLYVCFGSLCEFTADQLREIALGLEASGHPFLWVPGKSVGQEGNNWMPEGYLAKIQGKGCIVWGWAPQVSILNHVAVGGFVTHCGWNSILEGVSAGLPLITWPLYAEQFLNEKLIVDVLKIGVAVGIKEYAIKQVDRPVVRARRIEEVVREMMMAGEEGGGMRTKARELGQMAKRALREGGSSYVDMGNLIKELIDNRKIRD